MTDKTQNETSMLPDDFENPNETMLEEPTSEIEDTPQEEEVDPKPETSEEDPKVETTQDSLEQLFEEMELSRSFKSPEDALRRIPDMQRFITQTRQELAELKKGSQAPEKPNVSTEDFYENPQEAMKKLGYVPIDAVQSEIDNRIANAMAVQRANEFQRRTTDFEEVRPYMLKALDRYPHLENLPVDQSYEILYQIGRGLMPSKKPAEVVKPSPKGDPERAQTSAGKPTKGKPQVSTQDLLNMGLEEMEEKFGFGDN